MKDKNRIPLAVDLDGTLIYTDLIQETLIRFLLERPWMLFAVLYWWARGRAYLKQKITQKIRVDVAKLPYNREVLGWLHEQKSSGRKLYLVSGSDQVLVSEISDYCGIFDGYRGSDGVINCTGSNKAEWLEKQFGIRGFDYVGNSRVDLAVWSRSNAAIIVSADPTLGKNLSNIEKRFEVKSFLPQAVLKTMRIHQWVKGLLVFVPMMAAHKILDLQVLLLALAAFVSFCLMSSATYIFNDLVDIESDRGNSKKMDRPFASGQLLPAFGVLLAFALFAVSCFIALKLSSLFLVLVLLYSIGTLTYSIYAKSLVIADIVLLAGFYSLRILAGGVACGITVSKWLLLFSIFFFLGLACIKRFCEIATENDLRASRRGYQKGDLPLIRVMGICAGFIAVLVVALWSNSQEIEKIYRSPSLLWMLCPLLLYWVGRIWVFAERGVLHHDPVVFAIKDSVSYFVLLMAALIVYAAAFVGGFAGILK